MSTTSTIYVGAAQDWNLVLYVSAVLTALLARKWKRNILLWAAIGFLVPYLSIVILRVVVARATPTLRKYLDANPGCSTGHGVACNKCGSQSIRLWVREGVLSNEKQHLCNHCGTHLYST